MGRLSLSFLANVRIPTATAAAPEATVNKLDILINYISASVYEYISEYPDYAAAVETLDTLFVVPKNEIFSRHLLATRKQQTGETLNNYMNALKLLAKDCQFKTVSTDVYKQEMIRDAFINGIQAQHVWQRLLENITLSLDAAFTQARSLEAVQASSDHYVVNPSMSSINAAMTHNTTSLEHLELNAVSGTRCFFCGGSRHNRLVCPAKDSACHNCDRKGHFSKVCKSKLREQNKTTASIYPILATLLSKSPKTLQKAVVKVNVNEQEHQVKALIDAGSSDCFVSKQIVQALKLDIKSTNSSVSMAESSMTVKIKGFVVINLSMLGNKYNNVKLGVIEHLCTDIVIGHDILRQHENITMQFGGDKPSLSICEVSTMRIEPPAIFDHLKADCKPIATPSRRHSKEDREFIDVTAKR